MKTVFQLVNLILKNCKVMAKKQVNTSVEVTYKDGTKEVFETIEIASEKTGLEVNSIKSRANKPGSGSKSKDGITFVWADPAVRRSKTASRSKKKGNNYEKNIFEEKFDDCFGCFDGVYCYRLW